ncbi:MAG: enoyl-CoA hydratase/isomerase family protein, partial [Pseudomonadota bacterium]|nr:enoyl-CoA hydratase/isomerase family protein [Pseudomonadota bacterium]
MDSAVADLHAEKRGHAGIIVLDRPRARNALTTGMVDAMTKSLEDFQDDDAVSCVVLMSAVEGTFCAGGDVRAVRHARLEGRHE